jgi:hypothetical protein
VDGTLIEAWAGQKIFKPKDGPPPPPDGRGGVDFRGSKRTNDTNASTSDPEAKSARKGKGKEAKLCFGGDALMENRNGLCVDIRVSSALETESAAAVELLKRQARKRLKPTSLGGDKGYHNTAFVDFLSRRGIRPHIAQIEGRDTVGLDRRTTRHESYWVSQRKRKRSSAGGRAGADCEARAFAVWPGAVARALRGRCLQPVAAESFATVPRVSVSGGWR